MEASELVTNLLKGNRSMVRKALDGLSDEEVATRPNSECNSMAWLLWHLCRAEDGIVSGLDGSVGVVEGRMGGEVRDIHGNQGYGIRAQGGGPGIVWCWVGGCAEGVLRADGEEGGGLPGIAECRGLGQAGAFDDGRWYGAVGKHRPGPGERGDGARWADSLSCEGYTRGWGGFTRVAKGLAPTAGK